MARPLNFRQIEAFRAVMLAGTTISAAEMLHTTQPSVSRLLAQVQSATGLRLFVLERGRLRPTPEAVRLFEAVQRNFQGLEKIEQAAAELRKSGTGSLRVSCTPALALGVLPRVIGRFHALHPDVRINFQTVGSQQIRDGLLGGQFDVGLTTNRFHLNGAEFRTSVLHQTEAVCVMSPRHALAAKPSLTARDFQSVTLLALDAEDDLTREWRLALGKKRVVPCSVIETTYTATICALAEAGVGIGVVNPYTAFVFADRLRIARVTPRIAVKTFAAYPAHTTPSALTDEFVALLADQFRTEPRAGAG
jgi:DNA-binding transcriptional LysR family regulator